MFEVNPLSRVENACYLTIVFNGDRALLHVTMESISLTKVRKGERFTTMPKTYARRNRKRYED